MKRRNFDTQTDILSARTSLTIVDFLKLKASTDTIFSDFCIFEAKKPKTCLFLRLGYTNILAPEVTFYDLPILSYVSTGTQRDT